MFQLISCLISFQNHPTLPIYYSDRFAFVAATDINECLIPEFYCGPNANCVNRLGGFECDCFEGYAQTDSTGQCQGENKNYTVEI